MLNPEVAKALFLIPIFLEAFFCMERICLPPAAWAAWHVRHLGSSRRFGNQVPGLLEAARVYGACEN